MGYSFRLAAMVLLYAPSNRQDSTYHDRCYTSHGALAGTMDQYIERTPWYLLPTQHTLCLNSQSQLVFSVLFST